MEGVDRMVECTIRFSHGTLGHWKTSLATRAVKYLRKQVKRIMKTEVVTIDTSLNKKIWEFGDRKIPVRVRIRITRKRSLRKAAAGGLCSFVEFVPTGSYKGLKTEEVQVEDL